MTYIDPSLPSNDEEDLSVSFETPCEEIEFVPFNSDVSLLDADFIIFKPDISDFLWRRESTYMGKPSLSDGHSFILRDRPITGAERFWTHLMLARRSLSSWRTRGSLYSVWRKRYSGTGRNRATTHIVTSFNNYACIPISLSPVNSIGTAMVLGKGSDIVKSYWADFGPLSQYRVRLEGEIKRPIITTKSGKSASVHS